MAALSAYVIDFWDEVTSSSLGLYLFTADLLIYILFYLIFSLGISGLLPCLIEGRAKIDEDICYCMYVCGGYAFVNA